MRSLCPLNNTKLILISLLSVIFFKLNLGEAAPIEANYNMSMTETSGNPSIQFPESHKRDSSQEVVVISGLSLSNAVTFSTQLTNRREDYSNYSIQDSQGVTHFLSEDFGESEKSGQVRVDIAQTRYLTNLTHEASIGSTPFTQRQTSITSAILLNEGLSQVGLQLSQGVASQPLTYFASPTTGLLRARPIEINSIGVGAFWDSAVAENWKTFLKFETSTKTDRPRSYGITHRQAYAVNSKNVLKIELAHLEESKQEILRDERGYFSLNSATLSYFKYINYDLSLELGYGLVAEIENNPQTQRTDQLATDIYSVRVRYQGSRWSGELNAQKVASNIAYQSSNIGGGITWIF